VFFDSEGEKISVKVMYFPMQKFLTEAEQRRKLLQIAQSDSKSGSLVAELAKVKLRGIGKENKMYMRQYPSGPARGLFGLNTIKKTDTIVVLTEG
jgi:hypothetical protein